MHRLHLAPEPPASVDREQALVAETAIAAAGGGRLVGLHRDAREPFRWTATVAGEHDHVMVELDTLVGTVTVRPVALWHAA